MTWKNTRHDYGGEWPRFAWVCADGFCHLSAPCLLPEPDEPRRGLSGL